MGEWAKFQAWVQVKCISRRNPKETYLAANLRFIINKEFFMRIDLTPYARIARQALIAGFLSTMTFAAFTQAIVDQAYVQEALKRGAQVWDVRDAREFAKGHLPGALNFGDAASMLRDPNSEDFIAIERIEQLLGNAGINPAVETVIYGSRGTWNPYFGRYTLRYFGGMKASVFHEGIEGWRAAGLAVETTPPKVTPVKLKLVPSAGVSVTTAEMISRPKSSGVQIIDARTPKEFAGEDIRALRGGHIPGAINIPYEQNWKDPETLVKFNLKQVADTAGMSLKPTSDLKNLYAGLDPDKETVVYCQSGVRASETAGVLEQLGFKNVRIYDSSWLGYGNRLDAPAANESVFNVGALNARMAALQQRIDILEKELAAAKK